MKTFIQVPTKERQPLKSGWYDTDKGKLFFYLNPLPGTWTCREDRVSEEYPEFWCEEVKPVMDGWVSVNKEMPYREPMNHGKETLCYGHGEFLVGHLCYVHGKAVCITEETELRDVSHWKYLTEPTKEER